VIFWGASIALVLWVTGVLSSLLDEAAAIDFTLGSTHLSLRHLIEGGLAAGLVLLVTLSISAVLERQLIRGTGSDLSVRKMTANLVRALLLTVGFLVAMSMLGIDLTALSVLGGAIGVGLGLGLQRIVVNYVGGFVILAERVVRVGDVVKLDGFEGEVADIRSRYTLVRAVSGRESIVPNEMFVSQRVENLSLEGTRVAITSTVTVVHGTDVAALREKLASALAAVPRLLRDPEPSVQLSAFAPHGLELMLVGWIADPHKGFGAVRSEMNLAALAVFAQEGVEIARQQVAAVSPASAAATPADAVPPARTPLA
jgi:small-conductance mechanosensitive channel